MQARLAEVSLGDESDGAVSIQPRDPVHGDSDGKFLELSFGVLSTSLAYNFLTQNCMKQGWPGSC